MPLKLYLWKNSSFSKQELEEVSKIIEKSKAKSTIKKWMIEKL